MAQEVTGGSEKLSNLFKARWQLVAEPTLEHRAPESQTCPLTPTWRLDQQSDKEAAREMVPSHFLVPIALANTNINTDNRNSCHLLSPYEALKKLIMVTITITLAVMPANICSGPAR